MLPVPSDILSVVLDYLYTDDAWSLTQCEDPEFLCNVLVMADQLLIARLRDICEVAIASLSEFSSDLVHSFEYLMDLMRKCITKRLCHCSNGTVCTEQPYKALVVVVVVVFDSPLSLWLSSSNGDNYVLPLSHHSVSLKNACELLELASLYNATQLKTTCQQFITINLPALLEMRSVHCCPAKVVLLLWN